MAGRGRLGGGPFGSALAPASIPTPSWRKTDDPDYAAIRRELQTHKHLTLQLVWEEYRNSSRTATATAASASSTSAGGGAGSRAAAGASSRREAVRRLRGPRRSRCTSPTNGEMREAQLFVAVLGASSYTYAEATWTQGLGDWIGSTSRAFEFIGGVSEIVVPDNLKSGVTEDLPLRAGRESHLRRDGPSLRRGRRAGAPAKAAR